MAASSALSSSPPHAPLAEPRCSEAGCPAWPTHYCLLCKPALFCLNHCKTKHSKAILKTHAIVSADVALALLGTLPPPSAEQLKRDVLHSLFICEPHLSAYDLRPGFYLNRLDQPPFEPLALLPIVSFLGDTSSGKSAIILQLLLNSLDDSKPIVGDLRSLQSTTADVRAYYASTPQGKTFLICDCEGLRGTDAPVTSVTELIVKKQRHKAVEMFPPLLHGISSVLVFVWSASAQQAEKMMESLKSFVGAATSLDGTSFKPTLVIVVNRSSLRTDQADSMASPNVFPPDPLNPPPNWDMAHTTHKWRSSLTQEYQDILDLHFEAVHLLHVPIVNANAELPINAMKVWRNQLEALQTLVHHSIERAPAVATAQTLQQHIPQYLNGLVRANANLFAPPDLSTTIWMNRPVSNDIRSVFLDFYEQSFGYALEAYPAAPALQNGLSNRATVYATTLELVSERIVGIYWLNQQRKVCDEETLTAHLRGAWNFINKQLMPCDARHSSGLCCARSYSSHKDRDGMVLDHQAHDRTKGKMLSWKGSFLTPNLTGHMPKAPSFPPSAQVLNEFTAERHSQLLRQVPPIAAFRACFACLLDVSSDRLACGHSVCSLCYPKNHPACPYCQYAIEPFQDLPKGVGFRILSLDGGGIRGVVELLMMNEIQRRLWDIPLKHCFDYVIGTSAGSIVTATLFASNIPDAASAIPVLQEKIAPTAFSRRFPLRIFTFIFRLIYGYKYVTEPLQKSLHEQLGDKILWGATQMPKLAIVASRGRHDASLTLFASYFRHLEQQPGDKRTCVQNIVVGNSIVGATLASSAAPTFFDTHSVTIDGRLDPHEYRDGGILANNPSKVGLSEASKLWPEAKCDYILSLGTGYHDAPAPEDAFKIAESINLLTKAATDVDEVTKDVEKELPGRVHRLTPHLNDDYPLDSIGNLGAIIKQTMDEMKTGSLVVPLFKATHAVLASLFYAEVYPLLDQSRVTIYPRCPLPIELLTELATNTDLPFIFKVHRDNGWKQVDFVEPVRKPEGRCIFSAKLAIPLPAPGTYSVLWALDLPCLRGDTNDRAGANAPLTPISGCPLLNSRLTNSAPTAAPSSAQTAATSDRKKPASNSAIGDDDIAEGDATSLADRVEHKAALAAFPNLH